MKKLLSVAVLFILCFFSFNFFISAQEIKDSELSELLDAYEENFLSEQIDSMNIKAQINSDASVSVTEEINYDFGSEDRHGIFRTIPLGFVPRIEPGHITINVTGVVDEVGNKYLYEITSKNPINIKVGDPNNTVTGKHTYKISYDLKRSIGYFDNYDEWYWNLTGNDWPVQIDKVTAIIILPKEVKFEDLKLKDYCGYEGENKSCGKFSQIDGKTISYVMNSNSILNSYDDFNSEEGVTIAIGFPKNIVQQPTKMDYLLYWIIQYWFYPVPFLLVILALRKRLAYYWRRRSFYKKNTMVAEYDAGEFSPMETAGIVYGDINGKDLSAAIINLAIKGYLIIKKVDNESLFEKTKKDTSSLEKNEKILLENIESKKESDLSNSFYTTADEIISNELESLNTRKYINYSILKNVKMGKANQSRIFYGCLPLLLAIFPGIIIWILLSNSLGFIFSGFLILSGVLNLIIKPRFNRLTNKGFESERKLLGLREYIDIAEDERIKFHNAPDKNPKTFEKLLPYAIVFGLEKKWAKQFENIYITPPSWYQDSNMATFSVMAFSSGMHGFSKSAGRAMTSKPHSSSGSSSGGSSGGGSSGGGGGGGGGGSW